MSVKSFCIVCLFLCPESALPARPEAQEIRFLSEAVTLSTSKANPRILARAYCITCGQRALHKTAYALSLYVMTLEQAIKRYERMVELKESGATGREIAAMYGISHQAVYDRLRRGRPKASSIIRGILALNGFGDLEGRDRARMLVRIRDKFTCQDCGAVRTAKEVKEANARKSTLKGKMKLFDVHHIKGLCGKNSLGYDSTNDLSGMVTLCHKCHYNRPEHGSKTKKNNLEAFSRTV